MLGVKQQKEEEKRASDLVVSWLSLA